MAFRDLHSFIRALRDAGELVEIDEPVSIVQEIACAADRVSRLPGGGPALLFKHPVGPDGRRFSAPVLINAMGSERRFCMVADVENFSGLTDRLAGLLEELQAPRRSLIEKIKILPTLKELSGYFPKYVSSAPCQEVVQTGDAIDLREIPILTTWPDDGGPFVTFPLVFTESPADGKRNCGMYRIQIFDRNTTAFHVHTHHTAAEHMREARRKGENRLEAAIAIGGEPAVTFSAIVPLPPGMDEMILAGLIQGRAVRMVRCKTVNLHVPASADYVIEGTIHIDELRREGPFGDHTGFYSLADDYPTFHVSAITRRREPTYLTTVVGPPPQEDCWMGRAIERLFLPLMQQAIPEVVDYRLPFSGVFHNLMLVKIRKSYPGQARKVAHAIWGLGQAMFTKVICVLDDSAPDLTDEGACARYILQRLDASCSFEFVFGPTETLDHATRALHYGSKVSIDATTPMAGEPAAEPAAETTAPDLRDLEHARAWRLFEGGPLVLEIEKSRPHQAREIAMQLFERAGDSALPLIVILPAGLIAKEGDALALVWAALANIDPERDLIFDERAVTENGRTRLVRHRGRLAIDATIKDAAEGFMRDWPHLQRHTPQTLARVDEFLRAAGVAMPP